VSIIRSVRVWFALTVAVISAAIANPLVEAASNAGFFGRSTFTDHSNLDVLPALCLGFLALMIHVALRLRLVMVARAQLKERLREWDVALRSRAPTLVPATFAAQLVVLYAMETIEQIVVTGHPLGGFLWMGAPPLVCLMVHAIACTLLFLLATRVMHEVAWATLRVVTMAGAILTRDERTVRVRRVTCEVPLKRLAPALPSVGGRAPPSFLR
jgi:hypothetical protein